MPVRNTTRHGRGPGRGISRRDFLQALGAQAGLLALAPCLAATRAAGEALRGRPPNVIFIITDDQNREMFNFLPEGKGKNFTPHIDRLASEGTVLSGQHVSSPVCTPSRFSCLTGRYASRARSEWFLSQAKTYGQTIVQWNTRITPETPCLPKMLQQAGYVTGAVGKNHVIEAAGRTEVPSDADLTSPEVLRQLLQNAARTREGYRRCGFDYAASIYHQNTDTHNMDWITKGALDFIDQNKDRPEWH